MEETIEYWKSHAQSCENLVAHYKGICEASLSKIEEQEDLLSKAVIAGLDLIKKCDKAIEEVQNEKLKHLTEYTQVFETATKKINDQRERIDHLENRCKEIRQRHIASLRTFGNRALYEALQMSLIENLRTHDQQDEPYVTVGKKPYTRSQLSKLLEDNTKEGADIIKKIIMLSIDLVRRGKQTI